MNPLLILNDVHIGVQRMAGTTPASQQVLKESLRSDFYGMIMKHQDKDLCILGDLFDGFAVDVYEVLHTYQHLVAWLNLSGNKLFLVAGNHDIGKRSDRMSSFDLLAELLRSRFPSQVEVIRNETFSHGKVHMVPHCMNQDLFDLELEKAKDLEPGFLLLHANVDNGFAENSDHSLNVDAEWLTRLSKKHIILFAHEHQHRTVSGYKQMVLVLGNQWPSSIADCLAHGEAQKDGAKFAHVIHFDDTLMDTIEPIQTWQREGDFVQMDWTELTETQARFIRVTGKASAEQAADVVSTIAKYRSKSEALVISNAVQIEGVTGMDDMTEDTFNNVKAFDVLGTLMEHLTPREQAAVRALLED